MGRHLRVSFSLLFSKVTWKGVPNCSVLEGDELLVFSQLLFSGQGQGQELWLNLCLVISGGFVFSWRNLIFYIENFPSICIFFPQSCIKIVSPLCNLMTVMKHEREVVWVTCVVWEEVAFLWALILVMKYLEKMGEGGSLWPMPDGHPSWNLLLIPGALLRRVYFQY